MTLLVGWQERHLSCKTLDVDDRHYVLERTKSQRRHDRGVQTTYRKGADRFRTVFHASTATLQPERTWEKVSQREIKIRYKETFLQPESDQWMEQSPSRSCELWIGQQLQEYLWSLMLQRYGRLKLNSCLSINLQVQVVSTVDNAIYKAIYSRVLT